MAMLLALASCQDAEDLMENAGFRWLLWWLTLQSREKAGPPSSNTMKWRHIFTSLATWCMSSALRFKFPTISSFSIVAFYAWFDFIPAIEDEFVLLFDPDHVFRIQRYSGGNRLCGSAVPDAGELGLGEGATKKDVKPLQGWDTGPRWFARQTDCNQSSEHRSDTPNSLKPTTLCKAHA